MRNYDKPGWEIWKVLYFWKRHMGENEYRLLDIDIESVAKVQVL